MEIFKINNINELVKDDREQCNEAICAKQNIEQYLATYFAPTIDLKLETVLNLVVENDNFGITFDILSLLLPLAKLLNIDYSLVSEEELRHFLAVSIQSKLNELKSLKAVEELIVKFPTIYSLFATREEQTRKSIELELEYQRIIPRAESQAIKYKKLRDCGISKELHRRLLNEASVFCFGSFVSTYYADIERILVNLDFLTNSLNGSALQVEQIESLDIDKVVAYKETMIKDQKQRELK